jgi:hypothetical protein
MKKTILFLLIFVLLGCSAPQEQRILATKSAGRTFYVSDAGNDLNAGTSEAAPFRTIKKAAALAVAGDTINIAGGTYNEYLSLTKSGTASAPITFQGYGSSPAIITGGTNWAAFEIKADWIVVKNLTFKRTSSTTRNYWNVFVNNGNYNLIEGNDISGGDSGIHVMSGSTSSPVYVGTAYGNIVRGNTIHDLDTKVYGEGIYIKTYIAPGTTSATTRDTIIERNNISGSSEAIQNTVATWVNGDMVDNYAGELAPAGTIIRNNNIHDNHCDAGVVQLKGENVVFEGNSVRNNGTGTGYCSILAERGSYNLNHNLIADNKGSITWRAAIFLQDASGVISNNTIVDTFRGISYESVSSSLTITDNIIYGMARDAIYKGGGTSATVARNYTSDPLFAVDYRLQAGSKACGFGAFACDVISTVVPTQTPTSKPVVTVTMTPKPNVSVGGVELFCPLPCAITIK